MPAKSFGVTAFPVAAAIFTIVSRGGICLPWRRRQMEVGDKPTSRANALVVFAPLLRYSSSVMCANLHRA